MFNGTFAIFSIFLKICIFHQIIKTSKTYVFVFENQYSEGTFVSSTFKIEETKVCSEF